MSTSRTPLRDRIHGRLAERPAPRVERKPEPFVPVWLRVARQGDGLARDMTGLVTTR